MQFPYSRPRRLRRTEAIRSMTTETTLTANDLMAPVFVFEGKNKKEEISSMPGYYRYSLLLLNN